MQEGQVSSPDTPNLLWVDSDSDTSPLDLHFLSDSEEEEQEETAPPPKKRAKTLYNGKYWCFTENDPLSITGLLECFQGHESFNDGISYIMGQVEVGEKGRAHFQGYCEMKKKQRISTMKKKVSPTAHFERRKGTQSEAIVYCRKEKGRVDGPYEYGTKTLVTPRQRTDLLKIKKMLDAGQTPATIAKGDDHFATVIRNYKAFEWYMRSVCLKNPIRQGSTPVKVILLIGETATGKTRHVIENFDGAYWKPSQTKWWDGYQGEDTVIFDDFNSGWFTWDLLMRVTDRGPVKVETKFGYVDFCAVTMLFTSNTHPLYWYKNMAGKYPSLSRRFTKVMHFTADKDFDVVELDEIPLLGQPNEIINYS